VGADGVGERWRCGKRAAAVSDPAASMTPPIRVALIAIVTTAEAHALAASRFIARMPSSFRQYWRASIRRDETDCNALHRALARVSACRVRVGPLAAIYVRAGSAARDGEPRGGKSRDPERGREEIRGILGERIKMQPMIAGDYLEPYTDYCVNVPAVGGEYRRVVVSYRASLRRNAPRPCA
jgi:hypothetical protein